MKRIDHNSKSTCLNCENSVKGSDTDNLFGKKCKKNMHRLKTLKDVVKSRKKACYELLHTKDWSQRKLVDIFNTYTDMIKFKFSKNTVCSMKRRITSCFNLKFSGLKLNYNFSLPLRNDNVNDKAELCQFLKEYINIIGYEGAHSNYVIRNTRISQKKVITI